VPSSAVACFNPRVSHCVPPWDRCPIMGHGAPQRSTASRCAPRRPICGSEEHPSDVIGGEVPERPGWPPGKPPMGWENILQDPPPFSVVHSPTL